MLAVIFVRVGSRHNGGETNHRTIIRRDATMEMGKQSMGTVMKTERKKLRLSPFTINRRRRAKPADGK